VTAPAGRSGGAAVCFAGMSTEPSPPAAAPPRPPGPARALNMLSLGAVAVALGLVAAAGVPALWRGPESRAKAETLRLETPNFRPEGMPPIAAHPSFAPEEDEDDARSELEKLYPNAPWPGQAERDREREEMRELRDRALAGRVDRSNAEFKQGTARRTFLLLARPGDVAHSIGFVQADERVQIVQEKDGWALVIQGADSGGKVRMGWAKTSEIAIR
jgi:hypothetical protein